MYRITRFYVSIFIPYATTVHIYVCMHIQITLAHSTGQIRQINLTGDILEHTFYGLQSGVQYNISVTPWNSDQTGEMEYIVAVTDSITTSTADNTVGKEKD